MKLMKFTNHLHNMNTAFFVAIAVLVVLVGAKEQVLGGVEPLPDNVNSPTVEEGYGLIQEFLNNKYAGVNNGYETTLTYSDRKVSQQVVAGFSYTYDFKTTFEYKCKPTNDSNHLCQEKAPVTKTCSASVWEKPQANVPLEFAPGKEPQCQ